MDIKTETIQNVLIVQITNTRLVTSNTEPFKTAMDGFIDQNKHILIDMTRIEYLDSSGLGSLLHCLRKVNDVQGVLNFMGSTARFLSCSSSSTWTRFSRSTPLWMRRW